MFVVLLWTCETVMPIKKKNNNQNYDINIGLASFMARLAQLQPSVQRGHSAFNAWFTLVWATHKSRSIIFEWCLIKTKWKTNARSVCSDLDTKLVRVCFRRPASVNPLGLLFITLRHPLIPHKVRKISWSATVISLIQTRLTDCDTDVFLSSPDLLSELSFEKWNWMNWFLLKNWNLISLKNGTKLYVTSWFMFYFLVFRSFVMFSGSLSCFPPLT